MAKQSIPWALWSLLDIPSGVVVNLPAGSTVRSLASSTLTVEGSFNSEGTSNQPNVMGAAVLAQPWSGIVVGNGGSFVGNSTTLSNASNALYVNYGGYGEIHGAILASANAVTANAYVDATNVDWGSSTGPGSKVQGDVVYSPYVGEQAPSAPTSPPVATPQPVDSTTGQSCAGFLLIPVAGSGELGNGPSEDMSLYPWTRSWQVAQAFSQEIPNVFPTSTPTTDIQGLDYPAMGVPGLGVTIYQDIYAYYQSIYMGVANLEATLHADHQSCPNERFVLIGYSQGALVIHLALFDIANGASISPSLIAGVGLIADPAKVGNADHLVWQLANQTAGGGVTKADGIWTKFGNQPQGDLPIGFGGSTIEICHNHDIVCSPGSQSGTSEHENYDSTEESAMGIWLADRLVGLSSF